MDLQGKSGKAGEQRLDHSILVAIDGSIPSQSAATLAAMIAQQEGIPIQGLYIVSEQSVLDEFTQYSAELHSTQQPISPEELANWFKQQGESALLWLEKLCLLMNVPFTGEIVFGSITEEIIRCAAGRELLALGQQGNSHSDQPEQLGGHFQQIVHRAHVPVIAGKHGLQSINQVLLAYSGSTGAERALDWTVRIQKDLEVAVSVIAINENQTEGWEKTIREQLAQKGLAHYELLTRSGQPEDLITQTVETENPDLLILGGYHHKSLLQWIKGSTLDVVLRNTQVMTLIA